MQNSIIHSDQTNIKDLWENVLINVELSISPANFKTWFKDTYIVKEDEGTVFVGVPNVFARDWLSDKFHKLILKTLRSIAENVRAVEYIIVSKDAQRKTQQLENPLRPSSPTRELPLDEYYINKNDNLNPRYVFDTFVVGPFNELAYTAAQTVIRKPGIAYNPLFIYGDTGRGKTHLIQAVGNQLKKNNKKVFYVTAERFAVDYITSLQNGTANNFKDKYRQYDAVIMDDVQFLTNKDKTQEELFHLFNAFHNDNKQIVFSADVHPNLMSNMEERLKSRFGAGMIVDVPAPDVESRIAILKAKSNHNNFPMTNEIIEYLATAIEGNIRDLEGALNSIICHAQLKGHTLDLVEIKNLIKNSARPKRALAVKEVVEKIAGFYDVEPNSIYEKTRRKEVVKPRQLIMYVLREDFQISYPTIGQKLGGRDHTTVIHSCEKIKKQLKRDSVLEEELNQIRTTLR